MHLAHAAVIHNDITTADGEFDIFTNVTVADVQRVAQNLLQREQPGGGVHPAQERRGRDDDSDRSSGRGVSSGAVSAAELHRGVGLCARCASLLIARRRRPRRRCATGRWKLPPRPLAPRDVSFPPYEVRTLANGMQVMTVLHHEQPAVTMRLLVRAGAAQDPANKDGVAYLAAQLLDQGTTTKSASQIADEIDFIGGAMGTAPLPDLTVGERDRHEGFVRCRHAHAERHRAQSGLRAGGDRSAEEADSVDAAGERRGPGVRCKRRVRSARLRTAPVRPAGHAAPPETIAAITRDDLRAFHRRYFVPNNMILAIVGDVSERRGVLDGAERVFGAWPRADLQFDKPADPPTPAPARRHRRQAGRGADRNPRRTAGDSAQAS